MKTRTLLTMVVLGAFWTSCGPKPDRRGGGGPTAVTAVVVPSRTVTSYTSYATRLEGEITSAVRPKVSGYITEVKVDDGQRVSKGQVLFRLETASMSEDAQAAQANVNAAQLEVDKLKPLVEKNIVSEVQLQTAEAKLAQAKASYGSIAANIGYATIKSPITGSVGSINYRRGALVGPGDPTPMTVVSKVDRVYAYFAMGEGDYMKLMANQEGDTPDKKLKNLPEVRLRMVNGDLYPLPGRIETVSGQVDPSTGTVQFRAGFPNPDGVLSQGGSGQVLVPKTYEDVPVVPETASLNRQGRIFVYHVSGDTSAVSHAVEVLDRVDNLIVVGGGVNVGDTIVAQGVQNLRDNAAIKVRLLPFDSLATSIETVFRK